MFLADKATGHLVEVLDLKALFNPHDAVLVGRLHYGEEAQEPEAFAKSDLGFPSGEALPRCWTDAGYRKAEMRR